MCLSEILNVLSVPILELTQPGRLTSTTSSHPIPQRFKTFLHLFGWILSFLLCCLCACTSSHSSRILKWGEVGREGTFWTEQQSQVFMVIPCNAFQWDPHIANLECCPFCKVSFQLHSYALAKTSASWEIASAIATEYLWWQRSCCCCCGRWGWTFIVWDRLTLSDNWPSPECRKSIWKVKIMSEVQGAQAIESVA